MICLHHTDPDGWCSAAIVQKHYPGLLIKFYPITYGNDVPFDQIGWEEEVWIVDYSLTPDQWIELFKITTNVYWFDHHKTAIDECTVALHLQGRRKDGVAACQLVWEYFYTEKPMPRAVELTADYDVWKFEFGDQSRWFFQGLLVEKYAQDPLSEFWRILLSESDISHTQVAEICINGRKIKEYIDRQNKALVKYKSNIIWFEGLRICLVNSQTYGSPVFDTIDPRTYDAVSIYAWFGKFWKISFYTPHDDIDVSIIAVKYGGGGHRAACGCELKRLPFDFKQVVEYDGEHNAIIPSTAIGSRIRRWALYCWCRGRLW